jgi:hypothetical protein
VLEALKKSGCAMDGCYFLVAEPPGEKNRRVSEICEFSRLLRHE